MLAGLDLDAGVFAAALIFARMGSILMILPGFGEQAIPARVRLAFALTFGFALGPLISPQLPPPPDTLAGISGMIAIEAIIGLMIGAAARLFLATAAIAGQIIGYQTGLAMAQSFDPTMGQQGALPAAFLNLVFLVLHACGSNTVRGVAEASRLKCEGLSLSRFQPWDEGGKQKPPGNYVSSRHGDPSLTGKACR